MATEVWFRNPHDYIRELAETGASSIAWDRGTLIKKRIDPIRHAEVHYGNGTQWRLLLVGEQGTVDLRPGDTMASHHGVYPTWNYGESEALLEEVIVRPAGEDPDVCLDMDCEPDERPILGQEHRVVVTGAPTSSSGPGRRFLIFLRELQEDNPDCIIHLHGAYSWRVAFGQGLRSADIQPRITAQKGKVTLPSGKEVVFEELQKNPKWALALGFFPIDLKVPRTRCMFNIKSAIWAGANYADLFSLPTRTQAKLPVDTETPDAGYVRPVGKTIGIRGTREGDRFLCNTCSVQLTCSYFRVGAVCSVPGAEPRPLASYFNTRDSNQIIAGLGVLMQTQTRRLEQGLKEESVDGLQPEVTKMINSLFDRGVALAKLVDPTLRKPELAVNVGPGGYATILGASPQAMMSSIVAALEARGVRRDKITPEMVVNLLESMKNQANVPAAIEGTVISVQEDERKTR